MLASEALLELCQCSGGRKTKSFAFQLEAIGFRFPYAEQQIWKSNFYLFIFFFPAPEKQRRQKKKNGTSGWQYVN